MTTGSVEGAGSSRRTGSGPDSPHRSYSRLALLAFQRTVYDDFLTGIGTIDLSSGLYDELLEVAITGDQVGASTLRRATTVYSSTDFNRQLASVDQLAVEVCADQVSGTLPILSVELQHSGDGRNWLTKTGLTTLVLSSSSTNVGSGSDDGSTPGLGLFRVALTLSGTTPAAHVKVHVTGRDAAR